MSKHPITEIMARGRNKTVEARNDGDFYIDMKSLGSSWDKIYEKLYDVSLNGPMIEPKRAGDHPFPYDADITVKGSDIVLEGGAGTNNYGYCLVKYPKSSANNIFDLVVEVDDGDEFSAEQIRELLDSANIRYVQK